METDEEYNAKAQVILDQNSEILDKSVVNGVMVGFDQGYNLEVVNVSQNVAGATEMLESNTQRKLAALKQDPVMLGRNYSTTETLARVIISKFTTQTQNVQKNVAAFLGKLFTLQALLNGFKVGKIEVKFEAPMVSDRNKEEDLREKQIKNAHAEYNLGLIDHDALANKLGHEKAAEKAPIKETNVYMQQSKNNKEPLKDVQASFDVKKKVLVAKAASDADEISTDYFKPGCGRSHDNEHLHDSIVEAIDKDTPYYKYILKYLRETLSAYNLAVDDVLGDIEAGLLALGKNPTIEDVRETIFARLSVNWQRRYINKQQAITNENVTIIYDKYRKDKTPFGARRSDVPAAIFNVVDTRTKAYFAESDGLYLGKFITEQDTRRQVTDFLTKEYIEGGAELPTTGNKRSLNRFRNRFGKLLQGQDYKVNNIIRTTANKMRNYASLNYLNQAKVTTFEIVGIKDNRQCPYCKALQGYKFDVVTALRRVESEVASDPRYVANTAPFIQNILSSPEEIGKTPESVLQQMGIGSPPFHPNCRDRIVAVFQK